MALFKILRGNEANLPKTKTAGWAYVTTDEENMYVDVPVGEETKGEIKRIKIGEKALGASIDALELKLKNEYIKGLELKNNATAPHYLVTQGSDSTFDLSLPIADSNNAGLITNTTQTLKGEKTFSDQAHFTTPTGKAPFTVDSSTLVTNLNADTVDGLHASNSSFTSKNAQSNTIPTQYAIWQSFQDLLNASQALVYMGTIDPTKPIGNTIDAPVNPEQGYVYMVSTPGKLHNSYAGMNSAYCEVGDLIICASSKTTGNTTTYTWDVVQKNIDGAVVIKGGDAATTSYNVNAIPRFVDTTGKVIDNSAVTIDENGNLLPLTADNAQSIGLIDKKWKNIYGSKGNITTLGVNITDKTDTKSYSLYVGGSSFFTGGEVNINDNIIPAVDVTHNVGSSDNRWKNIYSNFLILSGATNATMTAASTNPKITFCETGNIQPVHLIYTDNDTYRPPAGLKLIGGAGASSAWLEVEGTVYAGQSGSKTGAFSTPITTSDYIHGKNGRVAINMTASAGYNMLDRIKSTNGIFTDGVYNTSRDFYYIADSITTNSFSHSISLLNENGVTELSQLVVNDKNNFNSNTGRSKSAMQIYKSDSTKKLQEGQLVVGSTNSAHNGAVAGGDVAIELWRGKQSSWQLLNSGSTLSFNNNYEATDQVALSAYTKKGLTLYAGTGAGSIPYLAVGQEEQNTDYQLYINGKGYFKDTVYLNASSDATLTNDGILTLGIKDGKNITLDNDEVLARNNGKASTLYLNKENDGLVETGTGGLTTKGILTTNKQLIIKNNAYPGNIVGENEDGYYRYELYSNSSTGATAANVRLKVYTTDDNKTGKYFEFTSGGDFKIVDGEIYSTKNGNTIRIGSQNANYAHFTSGKPFHFNNAIWVNGNVSPDSTAQYYLGDASKHWSGIYVDAVNIGTADTYGSGTQPIYWNAGVPTATMYSLSATVNAGTVNKLAYYSDATTVSSYTSKVGSATVPVYMNAGVPTAITSYSGNAASATKLQTARAINGTNFDGTFEITTAKWGTARSLTIGNSTKSVDGSGNVSWTLAEIMASGSTGNTTNVVFQGGLNSVSLSGGDNNTTGYRLVATFSIGNYSNHRLVFSVASRHTGSGILSISVGNNSSIIDRGHMYGEIRYFGDLFSGSIISADSWQLYGSADGTKAYLFWKYSDYTNTTIDVLKNPSNITVSNGTWVTAIAEATYGTSLAQTTINTAYRVLDSNNNTNEINITYSKAGQASTSWLASWNGYELGAISPNNIIAGTATKLQGFTGRSSSWTWGTLTTTNGYNQITGQEYNGGSIAFAEKSNQTSMQIDGFFYQDEGRYRVLDTQNYSSYAAPKIRIGGVSNSTSEIAYGKVWSATYTNEYNKPHVFNITIITYSATNVPNTSDYTLQIVQQGANNSGDYDFFTRSAWRSGYTNNAPRITYNNTTGQIEVWVWAYANSKTDFIITNEYSPNQTISNSGTMHYTTATSSTWQTYSTSNGSTYYDNKAMYDVNGQQIHNTYVKKNGDTMTGVLQITNTTASSSTTTGALKVSGGVGVAGNIYGAKVYGAVWNDYAEYRSMKKSAYPGYCVVENGDDTLSLSTEFMQKGAMIVSDTYGFAIGETKVCNTPIAVSGRVLAYTNEDREIYKSHIGDCVCAGPNGKICIMSHDEAVSNPEAIIGTISAVPDYKEWGSGNIKVDGRVWISVK